MYLPGSSQNDFQSRCSRPERANARSHRVLPSRASVRDRRDCAVCVRCLRLYGLYNLCALFIAIAFETCVVYARIWLLSGAKFKFPFCSLFPIHPPFVCNAPVSSVMRFRSPLMRFRSPLGATFRLHGGRERRGESPEWGGSPEGERPRKQGGSLEERALGVEREP